jgi:16S rRNA (cytosine967-C5)-methyltransferase
VIRSAVFVRRASSRIELARCACSSTATTLDVEELGTFDVVLLDAPCSGTGVLAGRPDARWKRTPDDVAKLVELQQSLLAAAARLVKPTGTVVYSTCSILRDEDEDVVRTAPAALRPAPLETNAALRHDDSASLARTWPHLHGTEGFFIAGFQRAGD